MNLLVPHGFEVNYLVGFARGLAANEVAFTVISDDDTAPALTAAGIAQRNLRGSVDPHRPTWRKLVNLVRYYICLSWTVFRHAGGTIHFCGLLNSRMIFLDGVFLPVWFRFWAGRYLHTAHNALPHSRENSRFFRWIYRWIYRFPHFIIAHTHQIARQLQSDFGVSITRIKVTSIGLNEQVPDLSLSTEEARTQLKLPARVPIALFFGKVEPYKGVDQLVAAWDSIHSDSARLLVVGSCSNAGYTSVIRTAITRSARSKAIEWREGFMANALVAAWFKACDVVVMPYRNIYQSGVVFLCLRFGIPIVATNVGSLAEYIDETSGIITRTNDPAGIAAALDQFFSDPARFQRDAIIRRASKYRWDRQCAAIKPLYD